MFILINYLIFVSCITPKIIQLDGTTCGFYDSNNYLNYVNKNKAIPNLSAQSWGRK